MRVKGKVLNGKVVLPEGVKLPEGAEVEIISPEERAASEDWMRRAGELRRRIGGLGGAVVELIREGRRL